MRAVRDRAAVREGAKDDQKTENGQVSALFPKEKFKNRQA